MKKHSNEENQQCWLLKTIGFGDSILYSNTSYRKDKVSFVALHPKR